MATIGEVSSFIVEKFPKKNRRESSIFAHTTAEMRIVLGTSVSRFLYSAELSDVQSKISSSPDGQPLAFPATREVLDVLAEFRDTRKVKPESSKESEKFS